MVVGLLSYMTIQEQFYSTYTGKIIERDNFLHKILLTKTNLKGLSLPSACRCKQTPNRKSYHEIHKSVLHEV
jgi:hypothetical protein